MSLLALRPSSEGYRHAEHVGDGYTRASAFDLFGDYYGHSDFLNFGYWRDDTTSQHEACENLMEELLDTIPRKDGTILDVACGKGATTRFLTRDYPPEAITGINVSDGQLDRCREIAPGCTFLKMDATDLGFADGTFDNIVCVEAAFHFDTRERFLREACRVLKPGGRLAIADILWAPWSRMQNPRNLLQSPDDYRRSCLSAGFGSVEVRDVTEESWEGTYAGLRRYLLRRRSSGEIGPAAFMAVMRSARRCDLALRAYVLASCLKHDDSDTGSRRR